jgi:hypothetical protein
MNKTIKILVIVILIISLVILVSYLIYLEMQPNLVMIKSISSAPVKPTIAPCNPEDTKSCGPTAQQVCSNNGVWGPCQLITCAPGYALDGLTKTCQRISCEPNQIADCIPTSPGAKIGHGFCNTAGTKVQNCQIDRCKPCYTLNKTGDRCDLKKLCWQGPKIPCDVLTMPAYANVGYQNCISDCFGYDTKCTITQCIPGYVLVNNTCLPQECTNGQNRLCPTLPANASTGTETCVNNRWGECKITACQSCYKLQDNKCIKNDPCANIGLIPCQPTDKNAISGVKGCQPCVGPRPGCQITACKSGYKPNIGGTACELAPVKPPPPPPKPDMPPVSVAQRATPMSVPIVKVTTY